jgi:hypothetical protein
MMVFWVWSTVLLLGYTAASRGHHRLHRHDWARLFVVDHLGFWAEVCTCPAASIRFA